MEIIYPELMEQLRRLRIRSEMFVFFVELGFELRPSCTVLLEPHLQNILFWLIWKWGLLNYLPGLASNWGPLDLNLLSS
jgi:hypothetical protein